jgi:hypothetical protein
MNQGRERPLADVKAGYMSIRVAAHIAAAAVLCACAGQKEPSAERGSAGTLSAPVSPAAATAVPGPANAPVSRAGMPGSVPLDAVQRKELDAVAAKAPRAVRARLRYALATADDGKVHLIVYDGEGLGADGRRPGHPREYVVFAVLNSARGEHYDPQQNSIVAPIPPPVQREGPIKP